MTRRTTLPSPHPDACPSCGVRLGEAFIRKLAGPQIDHVTNELRDTITLEVRAEMAGETAELRRKMKELGEAQQAASEKEAELLAEAAEKNSKLKAAQDAEKKARDDRRRLEDEKAAWDVEKSRMRDDVTQEVRHSEKARADKRIEAAEHAHAEALRETEETLRVEVSREVRAGMAGEAAELRRKLKEFEEAQQAASEKEAELLAEAAEKNSKLKAAQDAEKKARDDRRRLEDEKAAWDVEKSRMRDDVTQEVRHSEKARADKQIAASQKRSEQETLVQLRERDNHITQLREELAAANRRASAGPRPQEQGIARQESFAAALQDRFPSDDVQVVGRGKSGGDVVQVVRENGRVCGSILWESKDQQRYRHDWLAKLQTDVVKHGAAFGVLVTSTLPPGVEGAGQVDGVNVCDFTYAVPLAGAYRQTLITAAQYAAANAARHGTAERAFDYLSTGGFGSWIDRVVKAAKACLIEHETERRQHQQRWAKLDQLVNDILESVFTMSGEISAMGVELPPPLQTEMPCADRRELPPAA